MSTQALIDIYRTGFYISMIIAATGFLLSVFLFFRFRVKNIWEIRSGRAQKNAVRKMQEDSRSKGRMREEEESPGTVLADIEEAGEESTEELVRENSPKEAAETELLQSPPFRDALDLEESQKTFFEITQHIILIHTSETICE